MVRRGFSPFACVFTRADKTDQTGWRFFPLTTARGTADIKAVRAMIEVVNMTADCRFQFAFREGDDPDAFTGDGVVIDNSFAKTTDGFDGTTGYVAITLTKAYAQFGIRIRNDAAQTPKIELAWVSTRFDTRAC